MDFVASEGIFDEWQIGYQSYGGDSPNCTFLDNSSLLRGSIGNIGRPRATLEGYAILPTNDYKATMNAVAKMGPLVVAVACSNWHLYSGGVFTDNDRSPTAFDINHAVVLTGYGTDEETGEDFWLIRNSWGPRWYVCIMGRGVFRCSSMSHFAFFHRGENGYIRLKRVDPESLDDPDTEDCGMDVKPNHGETCEEDEDGNPITPPAVKVCGTSGLLFDPVLPIGGHLM
jgi:cathepsin L